MELSIDRRRCPSHYHLWWQLSWLLLLWLAKSAFHTRLSRHLPTLPPHIQAMCRKASTVFCGLIRTSKWEEYSDTTPRVRECSVHTTVQSSFPQTDRDRSRNRNGHFSSIVSPVGSPLLLLLKGSIFCFPLFYLLLSLSLFLYLNLFFSLSPLQTWERTRNSVFFFPLPGDVGAWRPWWNCCCCCCCFCPFLFALARWPLPGDWALPPPLSRRSDSLRVCVCQ